MPFSDQYTPVKEVPVATVATAYTNANGESFILVINEALWIPSMSHSLLNPNQLRYNGITVRDNPFDPQPLAIVSDNDEFTLAMMTRGTTVMFETWTPSQSDLHAYPHIVLTSDSPWDPVNVELPQKSISHSERAEIEGRGVYQVSRRTQPFGYQWSWYDSTTHDMIGTTFDSRVVSSLLIATVIAPGPLAADEIIAPRSFISTDRHSSCTPEDLSEIWNISIPQAKLTLHATTQHRVRSGMLPLWRRYRTDRMYLPKRLRTDMASDTMHLHGPPALDGSKYCQVFGNRHMFAAAYPLTTKGRCHEALRQFLADYGAPTRMITDGSKEQTGSKSAFRARLIRNDIIPHTSGVDRPNQNPAETVIRELRKRWYRTIFRTNCPQRLWNYALPYIALLMSHTASHAANLGGRTPIEMVTGDTPDISELLDFAFYDRVWYKQNSGLSVPQLGRFLGVSHHVGNLLSYWILPESCEPISCTTVARVTHLESQEEANQQRFRDFDEKVAKRFKEPRLLVQGDKPDPDDWKQLIEEDDLFAEEFFRVHSSNEIKEADDDYDPDAFDNYLIMEIAIDRGGDTPQLGRVKKRLRDANGNPIGKFHQNPILDTRMYEVEFHDGYKTAMTANNIAVNMFAQVDGDGHREMLFDQILEVRSDGTQVTRDNAFTVSRNGVRRRKETTRGWEVLTQWKDGSTTWNKMKDIKDAYPVQLAEFVHATQQHVEPAFAWWTPYVLKKKHRIIAKVKSSRTHKYGFRIPKTVKEALEIDKENGNTLWWDAIMLEMKNVRPAFQEFEGNDTIELHKQGYQEIRCHIIFDIKLGENFRRKARLVAGGHTTDTPSSLTYSSVVTRESVRIALTIAALNDVDILACDIQNAYLTAPCRKKIFTRAGPEFGSKEGKIMIVKMALYGLKSSGAAFHAKLAQALHDMQFRPSNADPDVWLRPAVKPNGFKYYEMVLCYVDDVLAISHNPLSIIEEIKGTFKLKDDKAEPPDVYLGAQMQKVATKTGRVCWTMSSEKYVQTAIKNVEEKLARSGTRLPTGCKTPMSYRYHPADDTTTEMDADGTQYFQELIGALRWAIELGRVDILYEVSVLSAHLAMPRIGYLQQVYHIIGYLKEASKRRLYMDPDEPNIAESRFTTYDWTDYYRDAKEEIPPKMPEPRGNPLILHCYVDAGHAADKATRRSQTGVLIFANRAPVAWYSKRQNVVETSTFGSELTAMKTAVEMIKALRYKLRMFGVPVDEPARLYCDNEAAFKNASVPDSTLHKKHHSIAYHYCREAVAAEIVKIAKEATEYNFSDLFTKSLDAKTRSFLLDEFTY